METIADLIERNERYYPEVDAFVLDHQRLTYDEYGKRAWCLAASGFGHGTELESCRPTASST